MDSRLPAFLKESTHEIEVAVDGKPMWWRRQRSLVAQFRTERSDGGDIETYAIRAGAFHGRLAVCHCFRIDMNDMYPQALTGVRLQPCDGSRSYSCFLSCRSNSFGRLPPGTVCTRQYRRSILGITNISTAMT